ncbi:MAG: MerC family mercury resistance protein [Halopseudomonas aestusnigri]
MGTGEQNNYIQAPKIGFVAGICATFSVVLCYGTLMVISLLHYLGVGISLNEIIWAGGIVTTATLSVFGLVLGLYRHNNPWPVTLGGLGAVIISYSMYVQYHLATELLGFTFLCFAALWDLRSKKITPVTALG